MFPYRNYWVYSIGLAVAWVIVLLLALVVGGPDKAHIFLLVFGGFLIVWV